MNVDDLPLPLEVRQEIEVQEGQAKSSSLRWIFSQEAVVDAFEEHGLDCVVIKNVGLSMYYAMVYDDYLEEWRCASLNLDAPTWTASRNSKISAVREFAEHTARIIALRGPVEL